MFLIHWPGSDAFEDSWKALEELYAVGKIKAIGVSNFQIQHLEKLFTFAKVIPAINQIELHPKLSQLELRKYSESKDIKIQAWSPLMQGKLLSNPIIESIATHHNKSTAQIILRWDVQQDILLNVKSTHIERMHNNADIFDFELTDNEMNQLNELNEDLRVGPDPDSFDFE
ncbi:oxidoreductase of aldo/keto reductase family, subgroup 1 [Lentilactobacillus kosonis]|uniref:Oxidoreductase of aldo/keto reductase family, subgroup 1 n=1 Tax=Lentilactobacillus kosonis TaxID=2810561 RepID=A0A401FIU9_9LACO|nr:oxidoreductase of aldo/keto reductase family, subgroup 1 [Lentilactobacillus kosonis]